MGLGKTLTSLVVAQIYSEETHLQNYETAPGIQGLQSTTNHSGLGRGPMVGC